LINLSTARQNLRIQVIIALIAILLFSLKTMAWWLTDSVAILTDGLESIANVVAGLIGVYSLYISAKPKDTDHPYGHGKVEFISAAVEGAFIIVAGILVIYKASMNLFHPQLIHKLDIGIILIAVTAFVNFMAGTICIKIGKRNRSLALVASGNHLRADMYTTLGIIAGLVLLYFTSIWWIDSVMAILFAFMILVTGYKILRSSIAGIMDEADIDLLKDMVATLSDKRHINWIDLHNLRIIKYGAFIHLDCHLTVPWYFNVHEAHDEVDAISKLVKDKYGESIELFVHSDGCLDFSCGICEKYDCTKRKHSFVKKIDWTIENVASNNKHTVETF
jgi:divalent metal cation (Fe/Co/Zn/Cd) transporter